MGWLSFLGGLVSLVLKFFGWVHDEKEQQIGEQKQQIKDLQGSSEDAKDAAATEDKVNEMDRADLIAELDRLHGR